ncbi:peptidase M61 [Terrimonas sp.]|uniref:M61 family metallopeptidase n=1 Tax=Terrimonas sp. TaxID=1914338 RepID=UPI000D524C99|nr:M61 family metallopeptidase [Terrimonas sp.]PVD51108.1 peptidase M61 [Terrimonas sp.]
MKRNLFVIIFLLLIWFNTTAQLSVNYTLSFPALKEHTYRVSMEVSGLKTDSLVLVLPNWMPGYYQLMNYAGNVKNFVAGTTNNKNLRVTKNDKLSWKINTTGAKTIIAEYDIVTSREFVANSYVDEERAYLIPGNSFMYIEGKPAVAPVVKINIPHNWQVATGLKKIKNGVFKADDFDILYDCPILMGNLEGIRDFKVRGINHRFIGYKTGNFDEALFAENLQKIVMVASDIIGEIPYEEYTFIPVGPGPGGIEHLNNTTFGFDGASLSTRDGQLRMYAFLAHEYFHHYNVKRIRPVELGPFDYANGNRTTQLWISEGLTVYYEYLIVKRAGLADDNQLLNYFEGNINSFENDPGREYQSLIESSYQTWEEGPFGKKPGAEDRSISYYEKGPLVGLLLDFEIRNATSNKHSLDDVMRRLYNVYYKEKQRGFTDAEFRYVCETIAGKSLEDFFRYIYTAEDLDYNKYLAYAGLKVEEQHMNNKRQLKFVKIPDAGKLQQDIYNSWAGN